MPGTTRRTAGLKGNESCTDVAQSEDLRVSFSNWILGGDIVISRSSGWTTKKTTVTLVQDNSTDESDNQSVDEASDLSGRSDGTEPQPTRTTESRRSKAKSVRWNDDSSDSRETSPKRANKRSPKPKAKKKTTTKSRIASATGRHSSQVTSTDESSGDESPAVVGGRVTSTSNWTPSQDALILSMREGGESWIDISRAISCGEREVERRWEELLDYGSTASLTTATAVSDGADLGAKKSEASKGKTKDDKKNTGKGKGKGKKVKENGKGSTKRAKQSGDNPSASRSDNTPAAENINLLQHRADISAAILGGLYDNTFARKIKPDDNFSLLDCRVLGLLSAKRKADRWLELQSSFYNATGRMVPLELLRYKIEEAKGTKCE